MVNKIEDFINEQLSQNRVVLFMKGDKMMPLCGFSGRVVSILKELKVPFKDINVLLDDDLRQGIKDYSNWPTIPQLYVDNSFIGGHDILVEMYKDNSLLEIFDDLKSVCKEE
ncbi:MAG: glutaredoxin-like protein GRLA [Candidatus Xenolissoclinum pacificiensis L6]|uniref:Glutaredoxin n=1 Tax=Candidatus Xenolissoclinum pacificiensis L6 TaxID=1401685 RepID=W2V171_9RICK|nr:MAG: glutaredoxin-like protein GRLA [Candidatus Xenolissoclinum pacificiensis L6]